VTTLALAYDFESDTYTVPAEDRPATPAEVRHYHRTQPSESGHGFTDDGWSPFFPSTPCCECGRFVGRDGSFEVEHLEMSTVIASVDGTCARCLNTNNEETP
jgi:hypothetical protein